MEWLVKQPGLRTGFSVRPLRFLRARLKAMVIGATADTLMQALATPTIFAFLRAALRKVGVIAPSLVLLVASPVTHKVTRHSFNGASPRFAIALAFVRLGNGRRCLLGSSLRNRSQSGGKDRMIPCHSQSFL